jgi:membrane protease YdiL (CAAX protease family)
MQTSVLVLLIAAVLSFFSRGFQGRIRSLFQNNPHLIWAVPLLLTGTFSIAAAIASALTPQLAALVLLYTILPVGCAAVQGAGTGKRPSALDFICILLLWLPLELSVGAGQVPRNAQGFLHSVGYAIAIMLGLTIFLCFRAVSGIKYRLPAVPRELRLPLLGFAAAAPVLAVTGILLGFIPLPHLPHRPAGLMAVAFGIILIGTGLPEEILFRGFIQNFLAQRLGPGVRTLLVASVIFGCAHLNNGPQPLPNWRYAILASIAGVAYGRVFDRASSLVSSAILHAMVDWTKHFFF